VFPAERRYSLGRTRTGRTPGSLHGGHRLVLALSRQTWRPAIPPTQTTTTSCHLRSSRSPGPGTTRRRRPVGHPREPPPRIWHNRSHLPGEQRNSAGRPLDDAGPQIGRGCRLIQVADHIRLLQPQQARPDCWAVAHQNAGANVHGTAGHVQAAPAETVRHPAPDQTEQRECLSASAVGQP